MDKCCDVLAQADDFEKQLNASAQALADSISLGVHGDGLPRLLAHHVLRCLAWP